MSTRLLNLLGGIACAALCALPLPASDQPAQTTRHAATKSDQGIPRAWPAETLTGTITMVEPERHLVVIRDASGTPFDIVAMDATRITSGSQRLTLGDLSSDLDKNVTLRFVPERRGDIARSIQLHG